jgi:uncharacterized LabA/DUF88 family protein
MRHPERVIVEHLGTLGLSRVLDDLLDKERLVRLANASGLKYPGMRTRSQSRQRILDDLVDRAQDDDATRKAIYRTLRKETRSAARQWAALSPEERRQRLSDERFLTSKGNFGTHLFLVAGPDPEDSTDGYDNRTAREHLLRIALNGKLPGPARSGSSRDEARLRKRCTELEKKIKRMEGQLARSREAERTFKRDLIERKGVLAESRMLVERLRGELEEAHAANRRASAHAPAVAAHEATLTQLGRAVRKLASEQKKLTHRLEKLPASSAADASSTTGALEMVQKELAALRRERKREADQQSKTLEELRVRMVEAQNATPTAPLKKPRLARPKKAAVRVGVFVDVQNMHYGARQLKGKLDFDAMLQAAVRDRRLIQATAYVVESKEIDQSGFIALLQQRGFEVRRKTLRVRADGSMKGDWDMELARDTLDAAQGLDVVVLVSGDGDFTSLVKRVKKMGPRVEVIGFPRTTAKALIEAADRFQPLDRKFMIYTRRAKTGAGRSKTKAPAAGSESAETTSAKS